MFHEEIIMLILLFFVSCYRQEVVVYVYKTGYGFIDYSQRFDFLSRLKEVIVPSDMLMMFRDYYFVFCRGT